MDPIPETPFDTLLARMYKVDASSLLLRPDAPAEFIAPFGPVRDDLIPAERLTEMLAAVAPPERWRQLQERGHTEFDLDTREGIFRFTLWKDGGGVCATIYDAIRSRTGLPGTVLSSKRISRILSCLGCGLTAAVVFLLVYPAIYSFTYPHRSHQSQSLNNVKQLTTAVFMYAQDYDGKFPGWVRNPDGRYAHNTWDEQINAQIKSKDVFSNGSTGIKSPSDPHHARVLTYALNGALIAPYEPGTGDVRWPVPAGKRPAIRSLGDVANPGETILFAEVATDAPPPTAPPGAAGVLPASGVSGERPSQEWLDAQPQGDSAALSVIDISPRTWVSGGPDITDGWYNDARSGYTRYIRNGVARDLYSGGGTYGFVDGHVKFMKIQDSVGIGKVNAGVPVTAASWFKPSNTYNMWNPSR